MSKIFIKTGIALTRSPAGSRGREYFLNSLEKPGERWEKPRLFNIKLPADWFVTILNCLRHPVFLTDGKQQIIYMNKAAQKAIKKHGDLATMLQTCFHWKNKLGSYTLIECDNVESAQRLIGENAEELFDRIFEGLHIVDDKGITLFYNKTCEELDGISAGNVIGRSILELYPNLSKSNSTFFKALKTGRELLSHECKYSSMGKKNIRILSSTIPLFVEGELAGAAEIVHDIKNKQNLSGNLSEMTERMKRSRKSLQAQYSFDDIIGENAELKKTIALAKQAAKTDLPVFIFGETGTGKELFAQSVHNGSVFSKGPFVAVNCAAIPDNLLESLLFGTVKGAFTGAENRAGLLEHAAGGSVFFDEVQALSSQMQAKLLRTLQEKTFQRVGSVEQIPFQARVISATNIAPEKAVAENALREDLYYRLCVFVVTIPPLKDRKDDLLLLSRYFLQDFNSKTGKEYRGIHPDSMRSFQNYHWPGNVRELEHLLLSQSIINDPDERGLLKIEPYSSSRLPQKELPTFSGKNLPEILLEVERRAVMQALQEHDSNVTRASAALGITRQSLQYRMSKLEIAVEREATVSPKDPQP